MTDETSSPAEPEIGSDADGNLQPASPESETGGAAAPDPAAAAIEAPDATSSRSANAASSPAATVAGRIWVAIGVAFVVLVLLIIFIAENSGKVTISFLGAHGTLSLGLAMLIAALAGVAITLLVGTARILQLRREVRRTGKRADSSL